MNKIRRNVYARMFLATLFLVAALFLPLMVMAQDTGTAPTDTVDLTSIITKLATNYPWVITVLTVLGIIRLVMKPLMTLIETVVAATPMTSDDEFLAKWEASAAYRWMLWVLDWLGSIKTPSAIRTGNGTTNPSTK